MQTLRSMTELNHPKEIAMNTSSMQSMEPEFHTTTPNLRFVFAVAALSDTLSVGGFVESLATEPVACADALGPMIVVDRA